MTIDERSESTNPLNPLNPMTKKHLMSAANQIK
jgi:hypothetical protein